MADGLSRHLSGDVITPISPPLPLPDGEGLRIASVSWIQTTEGAAATAIGGRNERFKKTPEGVFLNLSFARFARRLRPRWVNTAK